MIATNGMILNEENSKKLLAAGLDLIKIHISGFSQEIHSIQHRKGDVEIIKKNIRKFVELDHLGNHETIIMLDFIKYRHNAHEIEQAREFAAELGILFNLRPGNPRGMEDTEAVQSTKALPVAIPCDWLWTVLTVDWNKRIYPCCDHVVWSDAPAYDEHQVGETQIGELWNGPNARKMRRIHAIQGRTPLPICAECPRQGVTFKW
jgi:MoaA/NifB/PqqE/SkfB family radical SAM enzyme